MTTSIAIRFRTVPNSYPIAFHKTDRGQYEIYQRPADFLVKFCPALPADLSKIDDSTRLGTFPALGDVERAIAEHAAKLAAPEPRIPAPADGWSAADVLRLAHQHKVPGKLVKRYRSGRELRLYHGHQADNPHRVEAPRELHYTGE